MSVDYSKLWKLLIDKKINKSQLKEAAHISTNAVAKLGKNEKVSLDTLEKICSALNCHIEDIMDFVHNEGDKDNDIS
ncbi:MAG: helix-turn-helix domain-containing protein [Lachnospiraceae bacterium]